MAHIWQRDTSTARSRPRVVGRAGAGLDKAAWAKNKEVASIGRGGELRTASVLQAALVVGDDGPTVMNDLVLPLKGVRANIDHVVVSGRDVWLFDSKVWAPGTYWTFRGHTRRGLSLKRLDYMDKKTCAMARQSIAGFLVACGVKATVHKAVLVVWPSRDGRAPNLTWYRPVGARAIAGRSLARYCAKLRKPAANDVVDTLARLVTDKSVATIEAPLAPLDVPDDWLA